MGGARQRGRGVDGWMKRNKWMEIEREIDGGWMVD